MKRYEFVTYVPASIFIVADSEKAANEKLLAQIGVKTPSAIKGEQPIGGEPFGPYGLKAAVYDQQARGFGEPLTPLAILCEPGKAPELVEETPSDAKAEVTVWRGGQGGQTVYCGWSERDARALGRRYAKIAEAEPKDGKRGRIVRVSLAITDGAGDAIEGEDLYSLPEEGE